MRPLVPTLDDNAYAYALSSLPEDNRHDLPVAAQLQVAIFEWLLHLGVVEKAEARALIRLMREGLDDLGRRFVHSAVAPPAFLLYLAESRFAAWPMRDRWYDTSQEATIEELPLPPVSYLVCDVTALYLRLQRWAAQGGPPGDITRSTASPAASRSPG